MPMKLYTKLSNTSDKRSIFRCVSAQATNNAFIFGVILTALSLLHTFPLYGQFTVTIADSPEMPHTIRIGTEKIANTYIFTGFANAEITLPFGLLSLKQNYRGTAIRSANAAFRDDERLTAEYSAPFRDTSFRFAVRGFWLLSKDSRDIGLSSLSQATGSLGAKWHPARNITADIFAGIEKTEQLGRAATGGIFEVNADFRQAELGEFTGNFQFHSAYTNLDDGRANSDLDFSAAAERISDNGGTAHFSARYRRLGRNYFLPVAAGALGVESRDETRTEITGDILQPTIGDVLFAEAQIQLSGATIDRSFFSPVAGMPLTAVKRGVSEFSLNASAAIRLVLPALQIYSGAAFAIRDEANAVIPVFDISAADETSLKQSEFQRDNSSVRTRLFGQAKWKVSQYDELRFAAAAAIFRYDTPSELNYDDRDELLLNFSLELNRRFANTLTAGAGISAQTLHTVFINSKRSALNNQNQILKFFTKTELITQIFETRPQFELLANYTVYDFESVGGSRSFSFRQMSLRDSAIAYLGNDIHAEARIFARYFLTGQLDWANFSETPLNVNYEQFAKILIFTRPSPNISLGLGMRYYALSQQATVVGTFSAPYGSAVQQFYGPETIIDISFKGGSRLSLNGWYEWQFVNKVLLRNLPNLFFVLRAPL